MLQDGCIRYGSFVSANALPGDSDAAWETAGVDPDRLDPVLLDFSNRRAAMKAKYLGDGDEKGVALIDLGSVP